MSKSNSKITLNQDIKAVDISQRSIVSAIRLLQQAITLLQIGVYGDSTTMTSINQPQLVVNNGKEKPIVKKPVLEEYPKEFEIIWSLYPKRPNNNKRLAFRAWNARINEDKVDPKEMADAVKRYSKYAATLTSQSFIMQASTFFGPSFRFRDDFSLKQDSRPKPSLEDIRKDYRIFD